MAVNALAGERIGKRNNIRDWLFVDDHTCALLTVLERGKIGETYIIGGQNQNSNPQVVHTVCSLLHEPVEDAAGYAHSSLVTFVTDRSSHDWRYAIDGRKMKQELGSGPRETCETDLRQRASGEDEPGRSPAACDAVPAAVRCGAGATPRRAVRHHRSGAGEWAERDQLGGKVSAGRLVCGPPPVLAESEDSRPDVEKGVRP